MLRFTIRAPVQQEFQAQHLTEVQSWMDPSGTVWARGYVGSGERWINWLGLAAFRFDDAGNIEAFPKREVDAARVLDVWRRSVEPLVLQALGWETLHASAVIAPSGVVGFCGERGSGKSTIAYALGRNGYRQHSDDTIVVEVEAGGVRALDRPLGVRLRPEAAAFFKVQRDAAAPLSDGPVHSDTRGVSTRPLAALFVLQRVQGGDAEAQRLPPADALRALLAHAHVFNPADADDRRRLLEHYLEIAAMVPVYDLRFSPGLDRLGSLLACIERTVTGSRSQLEPVLTA